MQSPILSKIDWPQIFRGFLSESVSPDFLRGVMKQGDWAVATDRFVLIRVNRRMFQTSTEHQEYFESLPTCVSEAFSAAQLVDGFTRLKSFLIPVEQTAERCFDAPDGSCIAIAGKLYTCGNIYTVLEACIHLGIPNLTVLGLTDNQYGLILSNGDVQFVVHRHFTVAENVITL